MNIVKGTVMEEGRAKSLKNRIGEEKMWRVIFLLASLLTLISVVLISAFVIKEGVPFFKNVSVKDFLFSTLWKPTGKTPHYGILSFLVSSLEVTLLALLFSFPLSMALSIYLQKIANKRVKKIAESLVEALQGVPSVLFGLVGISLVVPFVRKVFGGNGYSIITGSIVLSIMVIPTLVNIISVSLSSVNKSLEEGSYALGATKAETILKIAVPSSKSGIITAVILALGRAVGETTAVLLVLGNAPLFPTSLTSMSRTLTMNIVTDMSYAEGVHMNALFATGVLLLVLILALNSVALHFSHTLRNE